jgi:hypothetical protein
MSWGDLLAYWRDRHVDGRQPSRADIDPPVDLPQLLPNLMLFEIADETFRVRLVGSEVTRRAGMDLTGRVLGSVRPDAGPVSSNGKNVPKFVVFLRRVVTTGAPVLYFAGRSEEAALGAIGLLLPLVARSGETTMVLGGLFYELASLREATDVWRPDDLTELVLAEELARSRTGRYGRRI